MVGLGAARNGHLTPTRGLGRALSKEVTLRVGRNYSVMLKTNMCQECLNFREESMVCLNFRKLAVTRALKLVGSAEKGGETEMNGPYAAIAANRRGPYICGITARPHSELSHVILRTSLFIIALVIGEETEA